MLTESRERVRLAVNNGTRLSTLLLQAGVLSEFVEPKQIVLLCSTGQVIAIKTTVGSTLIYICMCDFHDVIYVCARDFWVIPPR